MKNILSLLFLLLTLGLKAQEDYTTLFEPLVIENSFYYQSQEINTHGDVNDDGFTDIITKNQLYLFNGKRFDVDTRFPLSSINALSLKNSRSLLIDFDFDGDLDFIFSQNNQGMDLQVSGLFSNSNGIFSSSTSTELAFLNNADFQLLTFDFDNNGQTDIIAVGQTSIHVLLNKNQIWEKLVISDVGSPLSSYLTNYDLDNDGDLDIISSRGAVVALFNTGGTFETSNLDFPHGLKYLLTDFNNDGQFEVVSTISYSADIFYQEAGEWKSAYNIPTTSVPGTYAHADSISDLTLTDINADGRPEIVLVLKLEYFGNTPSAEIITYSIDQNLEKTSWLPGYQSNEYFYPIDLDSDGYNEVISIDLHEDLKNQNYSSTIIFDNTEGVLKKGLGFGYHDYSIGSGPAIKIEGIQNERPHVSAADLIADFNDDDQPDYISYDLDHIYINFSHNYEFYDSISFATDEIYYLNIDRKNKKLINTLQFDTDRTLRFIQYQFGDNQLVKIIEEIIPIDSDINGLYIGNVLTLDLFSDGFIDYIISLNVSVDAQTVNDQWQSFTLLNDNNNIQIQKNDLPLSRYVVEGDISGNGLTDIYFGFNDRNVDGWVNSYKYFLLLQENGKYDTLINNDQSIGSLPTLHDFDSDGKLEIALGVGIYNILNGELVEKEGFEPFRMRRNSKMVDWDRDGDLDMIENVVHGGLGQPIPPPQENSNRFWWNVDGVYVLDRRTTPKMNLGRNGEAEFLDLTNPTDGFVFYMKRRGLHRFVANAQPEVDNVVTNIDEESVLDILAYPNPVASELTIYVPFNKPIKWVVKDINGRDVKSGHSLVNEFRIDAGHLRKGLYFLRIAGDGFKKTIKFLKQ